MPKAIKKAKKRTTKPRAERLEEVRGLLASGPKSAREIAEATGASTPSARNWLRGIGAIETGKNPVRWTLPESVDPPTARPTPISAALEEPYPALAVAPAPYPAEPPAPVHPPSADAVQVLWSVEWGGVWRDGADENSACPECEGIQPGQGYDGADGHAEDCRLAAVLAGREPASLALPFEAQLREHLIDVLGGEGDTALHSLVKEAASTILHYEGLLNTLAAVANVHDETFERYEAALSRAQAALSAARKDFWPAMPTEAAVNLMAATGKTDIDAACAHACLRMAAVLGIDKGRPDDVGCLSKSAERIISTMKTVAEQVGADMDDVDSAPAAILRHIEAKDAVIRAQECDLETAERRISDLIAREHSSNTLLLDRIARMARHDARRALDEHLFKRVRVGKTTMPDAETKQPDMAMAAEAAQ